MNMMRIPAVLLALLMLLAAGCQSDITVRRASESERIAYSSMSLMRGTLTPISKNVLANFLLTDMLEEDPERLVDELLALYRREPVPEYLLALTEVAVKAGHRWADEPDKAVSYYLAALLYSYEYLAAESAEVNPYLPDRLIVLRFYNTALSELFIYLQKRRLDDTSDFAIRAAGGRRVVFTAPEYRLPLPRTAVERFELCASYVPENLTHNSRTFGIGAPLITALKEDGAGDNVRFAENQMIPATLVFEITGSDGHEARARLCYLDSRNVDGIRIGKNTIPLERDLSTPLAYMCKTPLPFNFWEYTMFPELTGRMQGLYRFEPYNDQRIPVVLVHGLMSNTRTWMQLINTLQSDPELRHHYQFWGFSYSSGNPILDSACQLRQALESERRQLVETGRSTEYFDRMVVIGHSMGGLLTRLAISDSRDEVVKVLAGERSRDEFFDQLPAEQREEIKRLIYFRPLPFVRRVIFVAVPHRGAELATSWLGRIGAGLIRLPGRIIRRQQLVVRHLIEHGFWPEGTRVNTGIDNLAPNDLTLRVLQKLEMSPAIPRHSIIGNRRDGGVPGGSDGVVPYSSSHLEGVVDELVVKSGHSVQQNALAIQAIRRILLLHLRESALPAGGTSAPSAEQ